MVTDICLKYILSYRVYASCHGCVIIQCLHCMIALCWRWLVFFLELYQLLQYSYDCSSVMSVHPEGGRSVRDTRISLTSVDMVSRLAKCCWMSTIPMVCRVSRQVVTALSEPFCNPPRLVWGTEVHKAARVYGLLPLLP